jgi:hypothetical protein
VSAATLRERLGLVALAYVHRAGFALVAAIGPAMLATRATASWPGGDAALFAPGSILAVESQRLGQRSIPAVFTQSSAVLAVGVLSGALVLGALIEGFARPGKIGARDLADGATRALGTVIILLGGGFLAELLVGAVIGAASAKGIDALHLDPIAESVAFGGATVLTLAAVAAVGVIRDLACTSAVLDASAPPASTEAPPAYRALWPTVPRARSFKRRKSPRAVAAAWRALTLPLAWAYAWRALATLAIVAAGILLGGHIASALVHQLAIFAVVVVHASWIRACVVAVEARREAAAAPPPPPAPHGLPTSGAIGYVPSPSPPASLGEAGDSAVEVPGPGSSVGRAED